MRRKRIPRIDVVVSALKTLCTATSADVARVSRIAHSDTHWLLLTLERRNLAKRVGQIPLRQGGGRSPAFVWKLTTIKGAPLTHFAE